MVTATLDTFLPMARRIVGACTTVSNSVSLRFIPRDDMEAEGYGAYLDQVEDIK